MAERKLKASDPADVVFLSQAVADTPTRLQPALLAEVYSLGLMLAQPLWVRIMFGLTLKVGGRELLAATLMEFQARRPDVLRMWVAEVAVHIRYGLDIEDSASVGGWSQREFNVFQSRISVSRLKGQS